MKPFVAYYRVSTTKQGQSGLGLEAQQHAVAGFLRHQGPLLAEYTEVESGKKDRRPQLLAAIAHAKAAGATLVIAKLDRLSRNAGFIFALKDTGVDFVCCDMPDANTLTVGIFAVIAQHERETISRRTKDALAAKKARGFVLGNPANLTPEARQRGLDARVGNARGNPANRQARSVIADKRALGWSLRRIAAHLNELHYATRTGKPFSATQVLRLA